MRDPDEGVDPDGHLVTGAHRGRIPAPYRDAVRVVTEELATALGDRLHSVYVYGSVATGRASPPTSDLDVIAVLHTPATEVVRAVARATSVRYRDLVREVAIGSVELATLEREDLTGRAERCFLRHYAAHLAGPDLRRDIPACEPSVELALGFNGDVGAVLDDLRVRLEGTPDPAERAALATRACRKLLLSAATLLSVRRGGWSTDRATAVQLIAAAAPEHGNQAARALAWAGGRPAGGDPHEVLHILDELGGWIVAAYDEERPAS
jgi:uncharacterized protein